jgi:hypothetical protein
VSLVNIIYVFEKGVYMNFEKIFKVAVLVLFVVSIAVYGMANRYQFFHISNSLTGIICDRFSGKCEWLSPEEMGKDKVLKYSSQQREEMEKQVVPQAPAPQGPRK